MPSQPQTCGAKWGQGSLNNKTPVSTCMLLKERSCSLKCFSVNRLCLSSAPEREGSDVRVLLQVGIPLMRPPRSLGLTPSLGSPTLYTGRCLLMAMLYLAYICLMIPAYRGACRAGAWVKKQGCVQLLPNKQELFGQIRCSDFQLVESIWWITVCLQRLLQMEDFKGIFRIPTNMSQSQLKEGSCLWSPRTDHCSNTALYLPAGLATGAAWWGKGISHEWLWVCSWQL